MVALDNTFGALFVGVVLAGVLYGFTCIQTWYYYTRYPSDPLHNKLIVAAIFFSDSAHQTLISHAVYTYLVSDFGEHDKLGKIVWSIIVEIFFNAFTTLFVQCFLAFRVHKLGNQNWLATGPVAVLITAHFIATIFFAIKAIHFNTFLELATLKPLSKAINVFAAAGDLLIAVLLCYMLHASRTGFKRSDKLINKLVMFTINTGLLTTFCAMASLLCISIWPHTFIYITFYFCIGRLYCNSLLATLNARNAWKDGSSADNMSLDVQGRGTSMFGTSSRRMPNNISIKIETAQEYEYSPSSGDLKTLDATP